MITRDSVLFVVGVLGIAYETLVEQVDRPSLLVIFGGCLGLPAFLRRDEKKEPDDDDDPAESPPPKGA